MSNEKKKYKKSVPTNFKRIESFKEKSPEIIVPATRILQLGGLKTIKFNKGMSAEKFLGVKEGAPRVAKKILGSLIELMMLDVIEGDYVYLNKQMNASISVNNKPILDSFFSAESHPNTQTEIPKLDVIKAEFKYPIIVFDPGREKDRLMLTVIPRFLFALLIDNVNSGKIYTKNKKEYILNTLNRERVFNKETRKWE